MPNTVRTRKSLNHTLEKKFVYDHVKACKPFDVEELLDIYINRKIAAPLVKLLLNTSCTPNQVTLLSLVIGISAAWLLLINHHSSPLFFATGVYLALILDCVDGQLARAREQASLSGRILDGIVDYLNSIAYFIGMVGFSLKNSDVNNSSTLVWSAAAALGMLAHAILHDYYRHNYITFVIKDYPEKNDSPAEIRKEYQDALRDKEFSKIITLRLYHFYLKVQHLFVPPTNESNIHKEFDENFAALYRSYNRRLIRLWSLIGMSSHLTGIFIASVIAYYDPNAFLYCFVWFTVIMTPYMGLLLFFQYKVSKKIEKYKECDTVE